MKRIVVLLVLCVLLASCAVTHRCSAYEKGYKPMAKQVVYYPLN